MYDMLVSYRISIELEVEARCGHRVIDITNGHFIHAGPLEGTRVSIYLEARCGNEEITIYLVVLCVQVQTARW